MDIYERLKQDHETQRDLAAQIMETSGDSEERRSLWNRFKPEAVAHANAEEQTFYAALIGRPEGQEKARHSVSEHKEADDLIEELDEMDMGSGGWIQKFEKLKDDVEHHMDEEENEVFALAQKLLSDAEERSLADEFEQRKQAELDD